MHQECHHTLRKCVCFLILGAPSRGTLSSKSGPRGPRSHPRRHRQAAPHQAAPRRCGPSPLLRPVPLLQLAFQSRFRIASRIMENVTGQDTIMISNIYFNMTDSRNNWIFHPGVMADVVNDFRRFWRPIGSRISRLFVLLGSAYIANWVRNLYENDVHDLIEMCHHQLPGVRLYIGSIIPTPWYSELQSTQVKDSYRVLSAAVAIGASCGRRMNFIPVHKLFLKSGVVLESKFNSRMVPDTNAVRKLYMLKARMLNLNGTSAGEILDSMIEN